MRSFRTRRQLRKLYLNEAMDATQAIGDGGEDAGALQNKIDSLKFELRMANTDKRKLSEERDSLAAKNLALKEDAVRSERTKNEAREETANLKTQMRYMQVGQLVVLIISVPIIREVTCTIVINIAINFCRLRSTRTKRRRRSPPS